MASRKHSVEVVIGAVDNATKELQSVGGAVKFLAGAEVLGALTKAAELAGRAFDFLKERLTDAVKAANVQDAAERDLRVALELSGKATAGAAERIGEYAARLQLVSTVGDETSIKLAALAVNFGANEKQTKLMMRAAIDMAAALRMDVTTAMRLLGQAQAGNVQTLARYLPQVRDLTDEQKKNGEAVRLVADRYYGAADSALTFGDRVQQTENILGDLNEQIGQSVTKSEKLDLVLQGVNKTLSDLDLDLGTVLGDQIANFATAAIRVARMTNRTIRQIMADLVGQVAGLVTGPLGGLLAKVGITVGDVGGAQSGGALDTFLAGMEKNILQSLLFGKKKSGPKGGGGPRGPGGGGGGGAGGDDPMAAVDVLVKMGNALDAMDDPAERIRQKFAGMRAEVKAMGSTADTFLGQQVLAKIDAAEQGALAKLTKQLPVTLKDAAAKVKEDPQVQRDWTGLGESLGEQIASGLASAIRGDTGAKGIAKMLLQVAVQAASAAASAFGSPAAGAAVNIGGSFLTGLIQHTGSPGYIPTAHGGIYAGDETMIRAQRREAVLSRQAVDRIGGPAAVAALNAGLGGAGGGGDTYKIYAFDSQSLDDFLRRGDGGDRINAWVHRRGGLA